MVPPSGKTAKASGASAAAAGAPARAESPPYVTSDTHQSMEAYQRNFWQRQMARVEEQVTLPGEDTARARAGKGDSGTSAAARVAAMSRLGNEGGSSSSSSSSSSKGNSEKEASAAAMEAAAAAVASGKDLMELFKPQAGQLPLARIKKVMKASDDDVKMISAEAPILFARACEIFIADLTCRSYMHATSHRRRTVQRSDVVAAVAASNVFDFLVDIVPRGDEGGTAGSGGADGVAAGADEDRDAGDASAAQLGESAQD